MRLFADGPWPSIELRPIEFESAPLATHLKYEAERSAGDAG